MTDPPPPQDPYGTRDPYTAPDPHASQQEAGAAPYGAPAPPPLQPGRPAPGTDLGGDLGGALAYAGNSLLRNPVAFLVAGLLYSIVMFLVVGGGTVLGILLAMPQLESVPGSESAELGAILTLYAVLFAAALLAVPFTLLWQTGSARAAGVVLDGGRPGLGQALFGPMRVLLTALLVGVITTVGMLLLYIPGLIASVLLMYSVPAALRGASPGAAISESFRLATANLGTTIVAFLVIGVISSVAGMLVVTVIALVPFVVLFQVGMYERLSGRELPDPVRG